MNRLKQTFAAILAVLMIVACIPFAPGAARAFAADALTIGETKEPAAAEFGSETLLVLPDGYRFTGMEIEDYRYGICRYITGPTSEFGYADGYWIDIDGNRVDEVDSNISDISNGAEESASGIGTNGSASPRRAPGKNAVQNSDDALPESYDARELGYVTDVESQVGGTCWAYGITAAVEGSILKNGYALKETLDLSEQHLIWYAQNGYYEGVDESLNDGRVQSDLFSGGNQDMSSYAYFGLSGPAQESRYNLSADTASELQTQMKDELDYAQRSVHDFVVTDMIHVADDIESVKKAILKYGVVTCSYREDSSYHSLTKHPNTYYNPVNWASNHEVAVIGWDDNFSRDNFTGTYGKPSVDGAWLIKNSWGTRSYDNGYFWMSYEGVSFGGVYAFETAPLSEFENVYFYDGYSSLSSVSASAAGNVFAAEGSEYLTKVSLGKGVHQYSFKVYGELPDDYTDPTQGTLLYAQSGDNHGYRYIDVNGSVVLNAGERFSVVFDQLEAAYVEGYTSNRYTSRARESFYYADSKWKDSHENGKHNVAVRAVTADAAEGPYEVTFSCPGFFSETRMADASGRVTLPETEGYVWRLTYNNEEFDGTGVDSSRTVLAHCYPAEGRVNDDYSCVTEYKCIFCGEEILPTVEKHRFSETVVAPTETGAGYTRHYCELCGYETWDQYTFSSMSSHGITGDCVWQYKNGVLSFVGLGATGDYTSNTKTPWYVLGNRIQFVYLNDGITCLGDYTCANLKALTQIRFPDSLTSIGAHAFEYADALETVSFPPNLTAIGSSAFAYSGALKSIEFNDCLKELGSAVFMHCTSLEEALVPGTLEKYSVWMYYRCTNVKRLIIGEGLRILTCAPLVSGESDKNEYKLEEIVLPSTLRFLPEDFIYYNTKTLKTFTVSEDSPYFFSEDGVLFSRDWILQAYPQGKEGFYYKLPAETTKIEKGGFRNNRFLQYIDMKDSAVTILGWYSLDGTEALKYVNLPANLTNIYPRSMYSGSVPRKMYFHGNVALGTFVFAPDYDGTLYINSENYYIAKLAGTYGNYYNYVVLSEHEHQYDTTDYISSETCSEPGFKVSVCECGEFKYEIIPASHRFEWVTDREPTCGEAGAKHEECSVCGAVRNENTVIEATGEHAYEWIIDKAATCGEAGMKHEECSVCGAVRNENTVIPAIGEHNYEWIIDKAATCGEAGMKHEECSVCGAVRNENTVVPATGEHNYQWITDKAATCGETGAKHEECTACGAVRGENTLIPATGKHNYQWITDKAATCGEAGAKHEECAVCGAVRNENTVIPATGKHSFGAWVTTKNASCEETGSRYHVCEVCGAKATETIKASGHKDADNDGFCDVCGEDIAPEQNNGQQEQQQSFIQRIIAFFRRIVGIFRSILGGH